MSGSGTANIMAQMRSWTSPWVSSTAYRSSGADRLHSASNRHASAKTYSSGSLIIAPTNPANYLSYTAATVLDSCASRS